MANRFNFSPIDIIPKAPVDLSRFKSYQSPVKPRGYEEAVKGFIKGAPAISEAITSPVSTFGTPFLKKAGVPAGIARGIGVIGDIVVFPGGAEEKFAKKGIEALSEGSPGGIKKFFHVLTDRWSQDKAMLQTVVEPPHQGIKGFSTELKSKFSDWVNGRNAAKVSGFFKRKQFERFDKEGLQGIFDIQSTKTANKYSQVRKYFDTKFKELTDKGVDLNYRKNYLPQLWNNTPSEIAEAYSRFQKRLTTKPSFALNRIFEDYEEGIKAGLTPRFNKISSLAGWYEHAANKVLVDREFFQYLSANNLLQPTSKSPLGWKSLDPESFPLKRIMHDNKEYMGVLKAPPDLADAINNYLRSPEDNALTKFSHFAGISKNIVLSTGIPKTGINAHGFNILARQILAAKNPVGEFLKGAGYMIYPKAAENQFLMREERAVAAAKYGLTLSTEEHMLEEVGNIAMRGLGKLRQFQEKYFADPLFRQIIPNSKLNHFETIYKDLLQHYPEKEAGSIAAEITNNVFGGINLDQIGRDKTTQQIFRSIGLAPDWLETGVRLGGGTFKSVFLHPLSPEFRAYRRIIRNLLAAYFAMDIINKLSSGHSIWKNKMGHKFEIEMGKTHDGKIRYIRPLGTAADFVRIPYDVADALVSGNYQQIPRIVANRIGTVPSAAMQLLSNIDYLGRPILGKDKYGRPIPVKQQIGGLVSTVGSPFETPPVRGAIDLLSGRSNLEQAIGQAVGLPTRYVEPFHPKNRFGTTNRFNF